LDCLIFYFPHSVLKSVPTRAVAKHFSDRNSGGEPFAQRLVRELGLPAGCVLVRSYIDGRERVVTADTRLEPHMRITAVIAPEANNALEILRSGCAAKH
jgi:Trk K+ transport system NAD-binding subunit